MGPRQGPWDGVVIYLCGEWCNVRGECVCIIVCMYRTVWYCSEVEGNSAKIPNMYSHTQPPLMDIMDHGDILSLFPVRHPSARVVGFGDKDATLI